MKITKKRIMNIENSIAVIRNDEEFHIAFKGFNDNLARIQEIGFSQNPQIGEQILPLGVGPISRFNANGKFLIKRNEEKETYYIERLWKWKDFQGNEYEKFIYIPRQRYPRELIPPPSEELLIDSLGDSNIIVSRAFVKRTQNFEIIKHTINLFLELFGECDLIREDYQPFVFENITRLNWRILPQGNYPWNVVRDIVQDRIERQPRGNRPVIANRLEKITSHNPNFVAVGQGGFSDYIVFGFPNKNTFILESIRSGNATYIFGNDWVELSKLTKAQILNNQLQIDRVLHSPAWETRINNILQ
ncbi:hypothetical protein [Flavobacterium sp. F52]|uniref:hypothetical protein n=1 Tax=Flavobacterium sp. F52 TaxID=1202532 RepID=UPI000272F700|nr:hypothetical protein [Flavobacterium sp. F52]EJG00376.1 hypothetical protein FF52_15947 [Flavobacterium sp. F52]